MDQPYRWNQSELAAAYDADGPLVHPHYTAMQEDILRWIAPHVAESGVVVDLGGGSGRLLERALATHSGVNAILVDQSESFLELAQRRLASFANRVQFVCCRLQDDWSTQIPATAEAIVSMSAIHHLNSDEKQCCYRQVREFLSEDGIFINGDEFRFDSDDETLRMLRIWQRHMQELINSGDISEPMADACRRWATRNIDHWNSPKQSGDDCYETADTQLRYLQEAGFAHAAVRNPRDLWALLIGHP